MGRFLSILFQTDWSDFETASKMVDCLQKLGGEQTNIIGKERFTYENS